MLKLFNIKLIVFTLLLVIITLASTSFAFPEKIYLNAKTYAVFPFYGIGISIADGDMLEIGCSNFTFLGVTSRCLAVIYSKQLESSKDTRTALNFGAIWQDNKGSTGFFGSDPSQATYPVV